MAPLIGPVSRNDFYASLEQIVIKPEQKWAIVMHLSSRNSAAYWPKYPGLSGSESCSKLCQCILMQALLVYPIINSLCYSRVITAMSIRRVTSHLI